MKTEELFAALELHSLHPILVADDGSRQSRPGLIMIGDLEKFIKSVQALNEKVVFITVQCLQEADFVHEGEFDNEELGNNDSSPDQLTPLATVCPEIEGFKSHLDQECAFLLSVYFKQSALHYAQAESWWLEFQTLREKAITALEANARARRESLQAEHDRELKLKQARQQSLIEKLRGLIKNWDFVELSSRSDSTQRGMQATALEMIPVLRELSPDVFKAEIQTLSDKIKAQKALQKK